MRSVVIISNNEVFCESATFCVQHNLSIKELQAVLQSVSPRFIVSTRQYYPSMDDTNLIGIEEAIERVKNTILTRIDKYNYEEIPTWHIVEDGNFDYQRFKGGKFKVVGGMIFQMKKEFQRCPLKYTYRNVGDGSWKTIEKL